MQTADQTILKKAEWVAGTDDVDFNAGPYASFDEALERAPHDLGLVAGDRFFVGVRSLYKPTVDARAVIDQVGETTYDDVGEVADTFLCGVEDSELTSLQETLQIAFDAWLRHRKLDRNFYEVRYMRRCEYAEESGSYIVGN